MSAGFLTPAFWLGAFPVVSYTIDGAPATMLPVSADAFTLQLNGATFDGSQEFTFTISPTTGLDLSFGAQDDVAGVLAITPDEGTEADIAIVANSLGTYTVTIENDAGWTGPTSFEIEVAEAVGGTAVLLEAFGFGFGF